ncbi:MAG: hypothetical protein ACK4FA_00675 [Candidatus Paceibacteria bacterium]
MKNKIQKNSLYLSLLGLLLVPVLAQAKTFKDLVENVTGGLANSIINFMFALAFVFFFWGVVQYVLTSEEAAKSKGRDYMLWGVIGLVVMFSVYGLVRVLRETVFFGN